MIVALLVECCKLNNISRRSSERLFLLVKKYIKFCNKVLESTKKIFTRKRKNIDICAVKIPNIK